MPNGNFLVLLILFIGLQLTSYGQKENPFGGYLPLRESPELNYSSPMYENEPLVFEAEPILYFNLHNTYSYNDSSNQDNMNAYYMYFNSHFRMFQGQSKPVRMPSYKMFLGYQKSIELGDDFFTFAIESGHYSNGQSGCAWADTSIDGSKGCQSIANSIHEKTDLSEELNRINGNFSLNLSRIQFQYVLPQRGKSGDHIHRFDLAYTYNHKDLFFLFSYGASSQSDIDILGHHRIGFKYEFIRHTDRNFRYSLSQEVRRLFGSHSSIYNWRFNSRFSIYPSDWVSAFFVSYIYGHDDYNYRIVDFGSQYSIGIRWDIFQLKEYREIE